MPNPRLRRLDEAVDIAVFDRGPYVAFANCGLPYYVGDVIVDERALLVASPAMFRERFNVDVYTNTEVIGIDRQAHTIDVRDLHTGSERTGRYGALVLSPGCRADGRRGEADRCHCDRDSVSRHCARSG